MRKPNPQKTQQNDAKSQLLQQASEVEKFFKESEYAEEFSDDIGVICAELIKEKKGFDSLFVIKDGRG